ncbi:MAG TPA: glutamate 5-kinase [Planctomycetota bacterium]|nr:glutamate 5-kinase [Planctomycetota bacterium]
MNHPVPAGPEITPPLPMDRSAAMAGVRRLVVKVGTNVLTRETGEMNVERVGGLVEDLVELHGRGFQVIVVSSGAISMGMDRLGLRERPSSLPDKQACAAVGQVRLMSVYEEAFRRSGIATAQILLTEDDLSSRVRYLNLRNTVSRLLEHKVVPIFNENDTVSTSEIEATPEAAGGFRKQVFGDNDRLSALVMSKLGADLLILLSDVEGLYPLAPSGGDGPGDDATRRPLSMVSEITPEIEAMARGASSRGRGGMQSKLQSIRVALDGGGLAVIAPGGRRGVLQAILSGEDVGTIFLSKRRIPSRKRWIAHATAPAGRVIVNAGARKAMVERRSSLLFAGVSRAEGDFKRGDVVVIVDDGGIEFARGIVNYSARDALPLLGKRSEEILRIAGEDYEELITRDNIVVTAGS